MRRWHVFVIVGLVLCVGAGAVFAQTDTATPTPTLTPTETPTPTSTPNVVLVWELPTQVNDLGTPQPVQYAAFAYSADAGQVGIIVFLAILVVSLWAFFVMWLLTRPRASR